MTVSAVQQAVDLLVGRLREARERHTQLAEEMVLLTDEVAGIEEAIEKLTGISRPAPAPVAEAPTSVRAAVKQILDAEETVYSSSTIRAMLPSTITDGKTSDQISNSVRSALWSLRQSGEAIMVNGSGTASTKWHGFLAAGRQDTLDHDNDGGSQAQVSKEAAT